MSNLKTKIMIAAVSAGVLSIFLTDARAQNFNNWSADDGGQPAAAKPVVEKSAAENPASTLPVAEQPNKVDPQIQDVLNRVAGAPAAAEAVDEASAVQEAEDHSRALFGTSSRYTLGPTDVIEIKVMRHPEVSGDYMINQEGKVQYEFVGDIVISGLTKEEAEAKIADKLSEYIISPEVAVKILQYNSKIVYVVGEVGMPGKIFMRGDTITLREALMQAGLPQLTGKTRKSRLITPTDDGNPNIRAVDVYALLYEGDLRQNFEMKPGDVVFIPATFLTKTMRAIQPVAAPVGTAAGTGRTVMYGF